MQFTGHHSGLFGLELDPARWSDFTEITERWFDFMRLSRRDGLLAHGWLDVHAARSESLG